MLCISPVYTQGCEDVFTGFVPVADLGPGLYEGFSGGRYPGGSNKIPIGHFQKGMEQIELIRPLNREGSVDSANGKIGFLILGYSTAAMTGRTFISVCSTQPVDPYLNFVIGAQGGRDINSMTDLHSAYWDSVAITIRDKGMSPLQIEMIWISTGDIAAGSQPFPEHCVMQFEKYRMMLSHVKTLFPNIRVVFASDRQFAGYINAQRGGPAELAEPTAYYSSWTVKWVIEKQIHDEEGFRYGEIPFIDWGPSLWTDGATGNKKGYKWNCVDAGNGGIHPSSSGRMKEAALLFLYFRQHPYTKKFFGT